MWYRFARKLGAVGNSRDGATAIEYALIAAGISLAIITTVFLLGTDVLGLYQDVESGFASNG